MEFSAGPSAGRISKLQKKRDDMLEEFEARKAKIELDKAVSINRDRFTSQNDSIDSELKQRTFGLVQLQDFRDIKAELEEKHRLQEDHARIQRLQQQRLQEEASLAGRRQRKRNKIEARKLSFDVEEEEEEEEEEKEAPKGLEQAEDAQGATGARAKSATPETLNDLLLSTRTKRMKKDPTIDTSFLPDREREEVLAKERMHLKKEWFELQDRMKQQPIHVTYTYWEAPGQRKVEACRQGDAVSKFLAAIRRHFPVIKNTNPDDLMLVKEGIIIPLHYTFYDFVINKTKGKHGLLFDPEAPADVDTTTPDAQICKVVDRTWYEKNRHIYPASQWELFDPQKQYGNVKVSGKDKLFDFF